MILVISNIANDAAPALVNSFPAGAASLVMASDVHRSFKVGISVDNFLSSVLRIHGKDISMREISGVVTTIPNFLPQECYYVAAADREYVCAELQAFFIYFLSELTCKKLNPPGRKILTGLSGLTLEWLETVRRIGIPVLPWHSKNGKNVNADETSSFQIIKCTVIGCEIVEDHAPDSIVRHTKALSRAFSLPYLACFFATENGKDYCLSNISTIPDITPPKNREAIVKYFEKTG